MKINLKEYIVTGIDGGLNLEATLAKFKKDASEYWEFEMKASTEIGKCVNDVFDRFPGVNTNSKYLVSQVFQALGADPKMYGKVEEKTLEWLHAARDAGILTIEKGKNGGIKRVVKPA